MACSVNPFFCMSSAVAAQSRAVCFDGSSSGAGFDGPAEGNFAGAAPALVEATEIGSADGLLHKVQPTGADARIRPTTDSAKPQASFRAAVRREALIRMASEGDRVATM